MPRSDPYTRSYHRFADEFPEIYADDAAYALWCRLRDEADKSWPSSAPLPFGVKRAAMQRLLEAREHRPDGRVVDAPLVILQAGGRYRVRGMDKHREQRSKRGKAGAEARWGQAERDDDGMPRDPDDGADALPEPGAPQSEGTANGVRAAPPTHSERNADAYRSHSERNANGMQLPSRAEPSIAEPTRAEQRHRAREDPGSVIALIEELTQRPFGYSAGSRVWETLEADLRDVGSERLAAEYRESKRAADGDLLDGAGLVFGTHNRLYPIPPGDRSKGPRPKGMLPSDEEVRRAFGG